MELSALYIARAYDAQGQRSCCTALSQAHLLCSAACGAGNLATLLLRLAPHLPRALPHLQYMSECSHLVPCLLCEPWACMLSLPDLQPCCRLLCCCKRCQTKMPNHRPHVQTIHTVCLRMQHGTTACPTTLHSRTCCSACLGLRPHSVLTRLPAPWAASSA